MNIRFNNLLLILLKSEDNLSHSAKEEIRKCVIFNIGLGQKFLILYTYIFILNL